MATPESPAIYWYEVLNSVTLLSGILLFCFLQIISCLDPKVTIASDYAWTFAHNGGKNLNNRVYIPSQNMLFYGVPGFFMALFATSLSLVGAMTDSSFVRFNLKTGQTYEYFMLGTLMVSGFASLVSMIFFSLTVQGLINSKFPMYPPRYCFNKDMGPLQEVQPLLKELSESDNPMLTELLGNSGVSYSDQYALKFFLINFVLTLAFIVVFIIVVIYILATQS